MTDLVLQGNLNPTQRGYLRTVGESAEALLLLLNDVLDFSKIEAGELLIEQVPFSLNNTLTGTVKGLFLKAHEKGLELTCRIPQAVPDQLVGDPTRLRQIVVNLVGNAIKFTAQGEANLAVSLEALDDQEVRLNFSVADTGIGIPAEKRALIFDAFSQADVSTTRQYGGTGLGLGISKELVEIMGGRIEVESTVGRGSRFHFTIPFGLQQTTIQAENPTAIPILRNKRVLVVGDSTTNRLILKEALSSWEIATTGVSSGKGALKILEETAVEEKFDVVCLDMHMPDMNGFEVARKIRALSHQADLRLIMLTSAGHAQNEACPDELEIDYYLDKPVARSELYNALSSVFGSALGQDQPAAAKEQPSTTDALRILLAEDTIANQHLVRAVLEQNGHQVMIVDNGEKAVAAFADAPFDLVLMDAQMPVMDGFDATARIRAAEAEAGTHTPIIALTARAIKKCV